MTQTKHDPRAASVALAKKPAMNGHKAVWALAAVILGVGGFLAVTLLSHVSRTEVHENGSQKNSRIRTLVMDEMKVIQSDVSAMRESLARIEARLEKR